MQNTLKIALFQVNQAWEDKRSNYLSYDQMFEQLSEDVDLVLLPEMFHTGFTMRAEALAEEMVDSEGLAYLVRWAKGKGVAIYTSLIIREKDCYYNRGVFIYPDGNVAHYDKRKTFTLAGESAVFQKGNETKIVAYKGWKLNLQICFDLRFPEIARNQIDENGQPLYDVILYVANWPEKRISHWDSLLKARAIENQCYVVAVNRVGEDQNGLQYVGHSQIIDANGQETLVENMESIHTETINYESLQLFRKTLPFLCERS